jgi:ATP-dependent DNA helicase PIF1
MTALDINPQFAHALALLSDTNKSLFITGKAGTGKSTLLDYFCAHEEKRPIVLAPTGVAALNVKGQTIHSFFHFPVDVTLQKIVKKDVKPREPELYKKLKTIIIDEISMVRADLLDCVDMFLRLYGPEKHRPFGGVQMVFVGDLYQLPPVVSKEEADIFSTLYPTPYFFSAHIMQHLELEIIELEKIYRQKDEAFVTLLNRIRNNSVEPADIAQLNSRHGAQLKPEEGAFYIHLTTTNKRADEINDTHLDALDERLHVQEAEVTGDFGKEYYPTAPRLHYKVGAQIMLLTNDTKRRWVNGSIGVIEAIKQDPDGAPYINVRLEESDKLVSVTPHTWEVIRFKVADGQLQSEEVGTFTQYPFRLAWAITIHKSQGKTFDHVVIDLGRGTFSAGQTYVALSRCTSFEGIILETPIKPRDIRTDYRIYKFLTQYQYDKAAKLLSHDDKVTMIQQAITEKKNLKMTYLKANDSKSERIITPLSVRNENYQGKTFPGMRAFCTSGKEERMFHVGRILELEAV